MKLKALYTSIRPATMKRALAASRSRDFNPSRDRQGAWGAAAIFGLLWSLALALAAVGLCSVVSYTVAQCTNEFGIRMAWGAQRGHVLWIVFSTTLLSVASGNSRDPFVLLFGALLLTLVSGIACAPPKSIP